MTRTSSLLDRLKALRRENSFHQNTLIAQQALLEAITPEYLGELIKSAKKDAATLSRYSYIHPNGFTKLLINKSDNYMLRLHKWESPKEATARECNMHNHSRDFWSHVLLGKIIEHRYDDISDTNEFGINAHKYWVSDRNNQEKYSLKSLGLAKLKETGVSEVSAGTTYWLQHDIIHKICLIPGTNALTLFLMGPLRKGDSYTYNIDELDIPTNEGPPPFTEEEYVSELDSISDVMQRLL